MLDKLLSEKPAQGTDQVECDALSRVVLEIVEDALCESKNWTESFNTQQHGE